MTDHSTPTSPDRKARTLRPWLPFAPAALLLLPWFLAAIGTDTGADARSNPAPDSPRHGAVSTAAQLLGAIDQLPPTGGTICLQSGDYVIDKTIIKDNLAD